MGEKLYFGGAKNFNKTVFRCIHASLYEGMSIHPSVGRSVGPSVGPSVCRSLRDAFVKIKEHQYYEQIIDS